MDNQSFIEFFLTVMHGKYFKSKRNMATALDIQHRTLQMNFAKIRTPKRAFLAFQNLILFCEDEGISVDLLYMLYQEGIVPKVSAPGKLSGRSRKSRHLQFPGAQKEAYIWYTGRCTAGYANMFFANT